MKFLLAAAILLTTPNFAQTCKHDLHTTSSEPTFAFFGYSVAIDEPSAIIGSPFDDEVAENSGSVSLYRVNPVTGRLDFTQRIQSPNGGVWDLFGRSVGISNNFAVIGSSLDDTIGFNSGAAYVYRDIGGNWIPEATLFSAVPGTSQSFGSSVDMDGLQMVVGELTATTVYRWNGSAWIIEDTLNVRGNSVCIRGDYIGTVDGIFRKNPVLGVWVQEQAFLADGIAVDDGVYAWVKTGSNAVHIGQRDPTLGTWSVSQHPLEPLFTPLGGIDFVDGHLLVGAASNAFNARVEVFDNSGGVWTRTRTLFDTEPGGSSSGYGFSISELDSRFLVAAPYSGNSEGRVFFEDLSCEPISTITCVQPVANSSGATSRMVALGTSEVTSNDVTLVASLLPSSVFGFFITSQTGGLTVTPGSSLGNLCLAGSIGRFSRPSEIRHSGSGGQFSLTLDLSSMPTPSTRVTAVAGESWHFQAWHRDMNPSSGSNFTDAVQVLLR